MPILQLCIVPFPNVGYGEDPRLLLCIPLRDRPLKGKLQLFTSVEQVLKLRFIKFRVRVALLAVRDMCGDHDNFLSSSNDTKIKVLICSG